MAILKPLKLRSEKVAVKRSIASSNFIVDVLVDTKVFHLDEPYSYLVPADISEEIEIGSLVKVPFGRVYAEGLVLDRREGGSTAGLKFVETSISKSAQISASQLDLFREVSQRYGVPLWDVFRLAVPSYSKTGEKSYLLKSEVSIIEDEGELLRVAVSLKQGGKALHEILSLVASRSATKVLLVVPDEKTLETYVNKGATPLSGALGKSERYANYLKANFSKAGFFVGLRSSVFIDLKSSDLLIVLDESDENMYEKRTPSYNVRDVSLLRAKRHSLCFISSSHSLEIERLVASGWLTEKAVGNSSRKVISQSAQAVHGIVSEGLKKGSVLLLHANKGYVTSFSCNNCRNLALCTCGEKLVLTGKGTATKCNLCGVVRDSWTCEYCQRSLPRNLGKGVDARAEEYGKSFPRVRVLSSSGQNPVRELPDEASLVISTPGMEPDGSYAAVLLMDGEQLFGQTGLRSDEVAELNWGRALNKLVDGGTVYVSLVADNPVTQSIMRNSFAKYHSEKINQKASAFLPPLYRLLCIEGSSLEISQISDYLMASALSPSVQLLGPMDITGSISRIIVKFDVQLNSEIVRKVYEYNRIRSLQGASLVKVRVDPFDLI